MPRINLLVILTALLIALVSFIQNDNYGTIGGILLATAIAAAWYWQGFIVLGFMLAVAAMVALSYSTGEYASFTRFMALLVVLVTLFIWATRIPRGRSSPSK